MYNEQWEKYLDITIGTMQIGRDRESLLQNAVANGSSHEITAVIFASSIAAKHNGEHTFNAPVIQYLPSKLKNKQNYIAHTPKCISDARNRHEQAGSLSVTQVLFLEPILRAPQGTLCYEARRHPHVVHCFSTQ